MISATRPERGSLARAGALAVAMLACVLALAAPAHAEFGLSAFSAGFHEPASFAPGTPLTVTPVSQAGAHADLTTAFTFNTTAGQGGPTPDDAVRGVQVDMPAGFYGNPQAVAACPPGDVIGGAGGNGPFGTCAPESQVGIVWIQEGPDANDPNVWAWAPVYNIEPRADETAALAFTYAVSMKMRISVRTDGDDGLRVSLKNLSEGLTVYSVRMDLWGVPADPVHDADRYDYNSGMNGIASTAPRKPFLTLPTSCTSTNTVGIKVQSWGDSATWKSYSQDLGQMTGCDNLSFDPSINVAPDSTDASTPTGYTVGINVPQNDDPDGLSTPVLKDVDFKMPAGVALSAPAAWGLTGCSDDDANLGSTDDVTCPETSKLGTLTIDTPLLADQLTGDIYLRSPQPGHQFRLLLVARGPGFVLKIPGEATPDEATGQIRAVFKDTPQLPFSSMQLKFRGGDRAPLANPLSCGTKTSSADLTPASGGAVNRTASFTIANCAGAFAPTFEAGTANPLAATFSAFTTTLRRPDGQDEIKSFTISLPPGLLGMVKNVPLCADAAATAGTCGAASQVGTVMVESGSGPHPYALPGKVYLAGPHQGAPFSLSVVVPAVAGPFDLGNVVVRAPISVDPTTAALTVKADLPTLVQGVPLRLQTISITIDRPEFMFNGTNCTASSVGVSIQSAGGTTATASSPYQPRFCSGAGFSPVLGVTLNAYRQHRANAHPELVASVATKPQQANLRKVVLALPESLGIDIKSLNGITLCTAAQETSGSCPDSSLVGSARATSVLHEPLSGPVHLVEGFAKDPKTGQQVKTLPGLAVSLKGEGVTIRLHASTQVDNDTGRVVETFDNIPDVPISDFSLKMNGGDKGILMVSSGDVCTAGPVIEEQLDGQNGKRQHLLLPASVTGCPLMVVSRGVGAKRLAVRIGGLGAGTLILSGPGIEMATRTIKTAQVASISAHLTALGQQMADHHQQFKVKVTFDPAGSAPAIKRTVTVTPKR